MSKVQATANVTVTIKVACASSWGVGTDIAQVHLQAKREAVERVRALQNICIVGDPKVEVVLLEPK